MMNVEERKKSLLKVIEEVENDMELLKELLHEMVIDLAAVKTEDDVREFDRTHDIESRLIHIRLI